MVVCWLIICAKVTLSPVRDMVDFYCSQRSELFKGIVPVL